MPLQLPQSYASTFWRLRSGDFPYLTAPAFGYKDGDVRVVASSVFPYTSNRALRFCCGGEPPRPHHDPIELEVSPGALRVEGAPMELTGVETPPVVLQDGPVELRIPPGELRTEGVGMELELGIPIGEVYDAAISFSQTNCMKNVQMHGLFFVDGSVSDGGAIVNLWLRACDADGGAVECPCPDNGHTGARGYRLVFMGGPGSGSLPNHMALLRHEGGVPGDLDVANNAVATAHFELDRNAGPVDFRFSADEGVIRAEATQAGQTASLEWEDPDPLEAGWTGASARAEGTTWYLDAIRIEPAGFPDSVIDLFPAPTETLVQDGPLLDHHIREQFLLPGGDYIDKTLSNLDAVEIQWTPALSLMEMRFPEEGHRLFSFEHRPTVVWDVPGLGQIVVLASHPGPQIVAVHGVPLELLLPSDLPSMFVGSSYDFEIELSQIYVRDPNTQIPETEGNLKLSYGQLLLNETGPIEVEVSPHGRRVYTYRRLPLPQECDRAPVTQDCE